MLDVLRSYCGWWDGQPSYLFPPNRLLASGETRRAVALAELTSNALPYDHWTKNLYSNTACSGRGTDFLCGTKPAPRELGTLEPVVRQDEEMLKDPIIVLGPARSFTTVIATMLGQHPQLYGFPETHLLAVPNMTSWWRAFGLTPLSHGLFRLIAEVALGGQNAVTIALARAWALRRVNSLSDSVFRELASYAAPLVVVDKCPLLGDDQDALRNLEMNFPNARYLHITRHPLGQGRSLLEMFWKVYDALGPLAPTDMSRLSHSPLAAFDGMMDFTPRGVILDPQLYWFRVHRTILAFLRHIPYSRQMRVRGEDVLRDSERQLAAIATWVGVRSDPAAIDSMMHPERSAFARFGPVNAILGGDPKFLAAPALRRTRGLPAGTEAESLSGPVPWRPDGVGFRHDVRDLAAQFGYS